MNKKTLLLNANGTPIRIMSYRSAIKMKYEGTAKVLEEYEEEISSPSITWKIPSVMIETKWRPIKQMKIRWSADAMFIRDNFTCQFCGRFLSNSKEREVEHNIPKSRGGKTDFLNCCCACRACNSEKGDRTCEEWGKFPMKKPRVPTYLKFTHPMLISDYFPKEWDGYVNPIN